MMNLTIQFCQGNSKYLSTPNSSAGKVFLLLLGYQLTILYPKVGPSDTQQQMRRIAKPRVRPKGKPVVERILFSSTPGPTSRVSSDNVNVIAACFSLHDNIVSERICLWS